MWEEVRGDDLEKDVNQFAAEEALIFLRPAVDKRTIKQTNPY